MSPLSDVSRLKHYALTYHVVKMIQCIIFSCKKERQTNNQKKNDSNFPSHKIISYSLNISVLHNCPINVNSVTILLYLIVLHNQAPNGSIRA